MAAYQPIRTERDPWPLLRALSPSRPDHPIAFPKVPGADQPLVFFATRSDQDFVPGAFGVQEPLDTLPQVNPHVILVPLVGFDARGYRMGYGGGFYDRTLAKLRLSQHVTALGFAYDGQLSNQALNFEETDLALDYVMTPTRLYDFTKTKAQILTWQALA